MTEWPSARLGEIATHIKDGTHGTHKRVETGIPFLSAKNVGANGKLSWDESDDLISNSEFAAITSVFQPRRDDLLLTIVGSVGRSALFDGSAVAFQRSVAFIRPGQQVLPAFLHYASQAVEFTRQLERRSNVTAQAGLYLGELAKVEIPLPPRDLQECVSAILNSLDNAIEASEALIEKQRQIKAGLMHELFTRGVFTNGQLRPSRLEEPHLYSETVLGWIPRDWGVDQLSERVEVVDPNPSHRYPEPTDEGVPLISTENFEGEDEIRIDNASRVPQQTFVAQNARCRFSPMDVVFARKGQIGLARRYGQADKTFSHTLVIMKPIRQTCDAAWLLWAARSAWLLNHIDRTMNSNSGVPTLGVAFIKAVPLPFPPALEQQQIAAVLDAAAGRINSLAADLCKLRAQKLGLMHDLLTGKVSIPLAESASA